MLTLSALLEALHVCWIGMVKVIVHPCSRILYKEVDPWICADVEVSLDLIKCVVGGAGEASNRKVGIYVCKCIGKPLKGCTPAIASGYLRRESRMRTKENFHFLLK
jgi:hypothetical protein